MSCLELPKQEAKMKNKGAKMKNKGTKLKNRGPDIENLISIKWKSYEGQRK